MILQFLIFLNSATMTLSLNHLLRKNLVFSNNPHDRLKKPMPHVEQSSEPSSFGLSPDQIQTLQRYSRERTGVQYALMLRTGDDTKAEQWADLYADRFRELFVSNPLFRQRVLEVARLISKPIPADTMMSELNELQKLLEKSSDERPH